ALVTLADADVPVPAPAFRLGTEVRPTSQRISLRLDPRGPTYSGTVRIQLTVSTAVPAFWLHAQDLSIQRATVVQGGAEHAARVATAPPDLLGVVPAAALAPGPAELVLDFQGTLDVQRSRGLYKVNEGDAPYLYTFFEPVDARRAFPCFDEPSFKIPWELEISVPPGNGAFANAAEASRAPAPDGWMTLRFAQTRPLPSYLVAFAAGPFDVVPGAPAGNHQTPLRFIVPPGHRDELAYAQSILPRSVALLEDATDVPYPYGKLDVLVVPRFWGTMEHPGLVALGQPLMLFPPGVESLARQQGGANIAIHELAHYWYGDLVTLAWWDDTWLNESFASWMDGKVTDRLEPTWRWHRRSIGPRLQAMQADALPGAKSIRQPVRSREDIETSFDGALTYAKGRTVIGMFERWIGEDAWRGALASYLRKYADRNVTSENLFSSLDASLGRNVSGPLATFVEQPGFPIVRGSLRCPKAGPAVLDLTQEPFLSGETSRAEATWGVPVCVRAVAGKRVERACTLLSARTGSLTLPEGLGCPDWVVLDDGGLGYYRSGYTPQLRARLLRVPATALSAEEQVAIASDLSALAERGEVPIREVLDRAVAMTAQEDSDVVAHGWRLLDGWLRKDRLSAAGQTRRVALYRSLGSARARALGWNARHGDSLDARELRRALVPHVALGGDDRVLQADATRLARSWLQDRRGPDQDVVEPVLEVAAARGDAALFDAMVGDALAARSRVDQTRIIDALGWFEAPVLAARARALVDDPRFELRDTSRMLAEQVIRTETRPEAWPFLRDHAATLVPRMRDDEAQRMIATIGRACDPRLAEQARASLGPLMQKIDGGPFAFRQALDAIQRCVAIHDRTDPAIETWLSRRSGARIPPR
ncbi:MAG TPA: M1 family metallopeptidase, partial [Myxococcaceae bacterium]|nr:M1 family metallopeptidase [Myxococcaceae bacterium]